MSWGRTRLTIRRHLFILMYYRLFRITFFLDLDPHEARILADRASLLSTNNLETQRLRYELQKFLPQDAPTNFGTTKRLLQAYYAYRDGPTELTARELANSEALYNQARNPSPIAPKIPAMREVAPLRESGQLETRFPGVPSPEAPRAPVDLAKAIQEARIKAQLKQPSGESPACSSSRGNTKDR